MIGPAGDPGRAAADGLADPGQRPASSSSDAAADTAEFPRPPLDADRTVVMSSDPGFRVGWRGYDRRQVDSYRSRVETELASARGAQERAVHAQAQTTERLRAAQSDLGRLRGQLTNSPAALSERLREILHLAAQEAEQTRADAQTEADQIRSRAGTDAETIVQQARDTAAGILDGARTEQQKLQAETADAQAAARQQLDDARADAIRLRDTSRTELDQLAAEAQQARDRADTEAAARRTDADHHAREQREQAHTAAAARLTDMTQQLTDLTEHRDETLATLTHLHQELANTLATTTGPASQPATGLPEPAATPEPRRRHR